MPFFKVTLAPDESKSRRSRNPFELINFLPLALNPPTVFYRVWKRMEAESPAAIRKYFKEAKKADLEHVRGHHIKSIKRLPERRKAS